MATAPALPLDAAWLPHAGVAAARPARRIPPFDLGRIVVDAAVIIVLLLLNLGGNAGAAVFFLVLAAMAMTTPQAAYKAIAIAALGLLLNTAFVPKSEVWTIARIILPFLAFARFLAAPREAQAAVFGRPWYLALMVYVGAMAVCSVASGWYTQIALLKLFNFWVLVTAVMLGAAVLRVQRVDLTEWFVSLILATTVIGLAAIATGAATASYGPNTTGGFKGAFSHQNCHALYGSLFVTFLVTIVVLGDYRHRLYMAPLALAWFTFDRWSQSRTAVISTIAGLLVLLLMAKPLRNRFGWRLKIHVRRGTLVGLLVLGLVVLTAVDLATQGSIWKSIVEFLNKGGSKTGGIDTDSIMASRTDLIEYSWSNFVDSPIFGIGFQVAKTEHFVRGATLFTAPAEKGFLVTAVLEEGGVLGAATFVIFLLAFVTHLLRERNVGGLVAFFTFLASNLGEVTMFSPGGAGFFGWIAVGAGMVLGDHCWAKPAPGLSAPDQWRPPVAA